MAATAISKIRKIAISRSHIGPPSKSDT